jgi:hypothetical protein
MRALPMITLLLVAVTACGSPAGSAGLPACTNIGTPLGVGIDLQPAIAAKVSGATLVACWAGDLHHAEGRAVSVDRGGSDELHR